MKTKCFFYIVAAAFLFAAGYTSCKDDTIEVSGVTLSLGGSITMKVGERIPLTANVEPKNATNSKVTFKSSNPLVADVVNGELIAYAIGETTITATAGKRTATCNVKVEEAAAPFVAVTGITGVPTVATAGVPLALSATVAPANATNKTIVWSIANAGSTGATIDATTGDDPLLNTTAAGTAKVRATIANGAAQGAAYTQEFDVTVNAAFVAVTDISGVPSAAVAGVPLELTATVEPANATNTAIVWSVADAGATGATVTGGNKLNTTAAGTAKLLATIANGAGTGTTNYTQSFDITVTVGFIAVTGITGVPPAATAGTPLTLTGTVAPDNATNKTIAWSVQSAGATGSTITGGNTLNTTAAGTATVRATIANGAGTGSTDYTQDFDITVNAGFVAVTDIVDAPEAATATLPLVLSATVEPANATNQTIAWSVVSQTGTGAAISGATLNTTAATTSVTVRATIANGAETGSTDYTQDFDIMVTRADLSGTVAVNGNHALGQTLTAFTGGLTSIPEIPALGALSYQWRRGTADITGATSATYTTVTADIGEMLHVVVTSANTSGSVMSGNISVEKTPQTAPAAPTMESSTHNSINLTTVTGCEYRMGSGAWQTSPAFTGLNPSTTYSFTQRRAETATQTASPASAAASFATQAAGSDSGLPGNYPEIGL